MSEHDALNDDGFHEIQLSGKQLVALFMATTVVAVVIFLCGVQVGRNVKGDRVLAEPADTSAAADPAPASTPTQATPSAGPPAAEPPAPAQDDELSYAKRLQQADQPASEKLASPPQTAAPPLVAKQQPAAPPAATPAPAAAPSAGKPGAWIVQLSALQDRGVAANTVRDLVAKGYPAFVLDPAPGAPAIYRVQVGGYPDRDKADQAARRLEKEEHYKPYVRSR
jgi:cell division septation protein DedD